MYSLEVSVFRWNYTPRQNIYESHLGGDVTCNKTGSGTVVGTKWVLPAARFYYPSATTVMLGAENIKKMYVWTRTYHKEFRFEGTRLRF